MNRVRNRTMEILLIEDDAFDAVITKKYLDRENLKYTLNRVHDGEEALEYLNQRGKFSASRKPDLVLLDMGLPRMNGDQVLSEIKKSSSLNKIPVVILTGQSLEDNPINKYDLFEHCYVNKWFGMKDFISFVRAVGDSRMS